MVTSGWILGGKVQAPSWLQVLRHCLLAHSGLRVYIAHVGALALEQCQCVLQDDFDSDVILDRQLSSKYLIRGAVNDALIDHLACGQTPYPACVDVGNVGSALGRCDHMRGLDECPGHSA